MKHESEFRARLGQEPDGNELTAVWDLLERDEAAEGASTEAVDASWDALRQRLESPVSSATGAAATDDGVVSINAARRRALRASGPASSASTRRTLLRAAAIVGVTLAGGAIWQSVPVVHTAAVGEQIAVTLPDGSDVRLNAGSTLRHRRGFALLPGIAASERSVELSGEGFFDVESTGRPFVVRAGESRIRVLGTRFDVRARSAAESDAGIAGALRVEVEEGSVSVSTVSAPDRAVVLERGEAVSLDPRSGALAVEDVVVERIGTWRAGGLAMIDEPLAAIAIELSLRFAETITVADSVEGSRRLSVYYTSLQSLESVLGDVSTQQGLGFRRTANGWEIF